MELTQNYKQQATFTRLRTQYKRFLSSFLSQNTDVFQALSRSGTPYGGNWLPVNQYAATPKSINALQKKLVDIQQQLGELTNHLAQLNNEISVLQHSSEAGTATLSRTQSASQAKEIGINRFRAMPVN